MRNYHCKDLCQRHAGFGAQDAVVRIEFQQAVDAFRQQHAPIFIQRRIAIAASLAARDHAVRSGRRSA